LLADLAKFGRSCGRLCAVAGATVGVGDYGEVARDWNYAAATICAESAFNFHDSDAKKFIHVESAFMRFIALTVLRTLRRLNALL
jgi:hypothetical protein